MKDHTTILAILSIILSLTIALFAYFLIIHYFIDVDLQKSQRENTILNFYEHPHDRDIFIVGNSMVNEGFDANLIEDSLQERHINQSVYILGINAETPLSMVPMLDKVTASRPDLVVIGLSYGDLANDTNIYDDRFALISQKISVNDEYRFLFNDEQLKLLSQTSLEYDFYKRKFIISSIYRFIRELFFKSEISPRKNLFISNFKDPWVVTINLTETEKIEKLKNAKKFDLVFEDLNSQKKALLYTINKLQRNNISVLIVNMPLDLNYSKFINESTRHHYFNFLNETGVPWLDYEHEYPSDFFSDHVHMNVAGRTDFSQKIAAILVNNLTRCTNAV